MMQQHEAAPRGDDQVSLATPCSVAPMLIKELAGGDDQQQQQQRSRRSLALKFSTSVPNRVSKSDVDFPKLWPFLSSQGWRFVCGDRLFSNYYVAPGFSKAEARLNQEKFGDADKLLEHILRCKDAFRGVLEAYFAKHPAPFRPVPNLRVEDVLWGPLFSILKRHGWKAFSGGLLSDHVYANEHVQSKQAALDSLGRHAFLSSREATEYLLANQERHVEILAEYFEKHPPPNVSEVATPTAAASAPPAQELPAHSTPPARSQSANVSPVSGGSGDKGNTDTEENELASMYANMDFDDAENRDTSNAGTGNAERGNEDKDKDENNAEGEAEAGGKGAARSVRRGSKRPESPVGADAPANKRARSKTPPLLPEDMRGKFFNFVWPVLKHEDGWTHATGDMLHSFSFLQPHIKAKSDGVEGKDYFVGEDALVDYVLEHRSELLERFHQSERANEVAVARARREASAATARQREVSERAAEAKAVVFTELKEHKAARATIKRSSSSGARFKEVYRDLRAKGWTYKPAPHMLKNYYYLAPGIKSVRDGRLGENMFDSEDSLMEYYYTHVKPKDAGVSEAETVDAGGNASSSDDDGGDDDGDNLVAMEQEDVASPIPTGGQRLQSDDDDDDNGGEEEDDDDDDDDEDGKAAEDDEVKSINTQAAFNDIWPELQKRGWKFFKGSGLASFYYAMPHVSAKSEGVLGKDMFSSEAAVVQSYRASHTAQSSSNQHDSPPPAGNDGSASSSPSASESDEGEGDAGEQGSRSKRLQHPGRRARTRKSASGGSNRSAQTSSRRRTTKTPASAPPKARGLFQRKRKAADRKEGPSDDRQDDAALFDFLWKRMAADHGWGRAYVKLAPDGSVDECFTDQESFIKHVCKDHANYVLEYHTKQKRKRADSE